MRSFVYYAEHDNSTHCWCFVS